MEQNYSVILENGEEYVKLNSVLHKGTEYILLSNISNLKDICIRKIVKENDVEYICRLEEKELDEVLKLFNSLKKDN